jgi:hypothetical protein
MLTNFNKPDFPRPSAISQSVGVTTCPGMSLYAINPHMPRTPIEIEAANRAEATAVLIRAGYRVYRPEADVNGVEVVKQDSPTKCQTLFNNNAPPRRCIVGATKRAPDSVQSGI